jgi:hypothetical protein
MKPLEAPEIDKIDENETRAEKFWKYIPVIGWLIASAECNHRALPIVANVNAQLKEREPLPLSAWGQDEERQKFVAWLLPTIAHEMTWESDCFVLEDPIGVVLWAHADGLDLGSFLLDVDEHLSLAKSLLDEKVNDWFEQKLTLGEWIDILLSLPRGPDRFSESIWERIRKNFRRNALKK